MPRECMTEMKASKGKSHSLLATHWAPTVGSVIKCEDYSTLTHLLQVTAYVLRAVKLFKRSIVHPKKPLSPEELVEAEKLWIVHTQVQLKDETTLDQRTE